MNPLATPGPPPTSDVSPPPPDPGANLVDASSNARVGNLILDSIGFVALMLVIDYSLPLAGVTMSLRDTNRIGAVGFLVYYILFEAVFGRTPGKFLTETRVVNRAGGKPSFGQILGRTFLRFVPFEAVSFLFKPGTGRWHDRWSGTRVVRVPAGQ